jgi:hypothetical protein
MGKIGEREKNNKTLLNPPQKMGIVYLLLSTDLAQVAVH